MRHDGVSRIVAAAELRQIGIDDLPSLRHLHGLAARCSAASCLEPDETERLCAWLASPAYCDRLISERHLGLWLDGTLIGTAGWTKSEETTYTAKLRGPFVSPLYARLSLGQRLLRAVENEARAFGFGRFTVGCLASNVAFFADNGYEMAAAGFFPLPHREGIPLSFMKKIDQGYEGSTPPLATVA